MEQLVPLIFAVAGFVGFIVLVTVISDNRTLNGIKSKTVGDGQHGTARWATYAHVPFMVKDWRKGSHRPKEQGLVLGSTGKKGSVTALVDNDDILRWPLPPPDPGTHHPARRIDAEPMNCGISSQPIGSFLFFQQRIGLVEASIL